MTRSEALTIDVARVDAVTLDFYNTLVYHKQGSGRGPMLMEYLKSQGLECDPWEHQVLYDLFDAHATDYSPNFGDDAKQRYLEWFTKRLFEHLNVRVPTGSEKDHAGEVWRVLGPSSLGVYPEVPRVLRALREAGYPLSIISNWQCGLAHFCHELGLVDAVDHIIASAEVRSVKPNPRIFREACDRMCVPCERILHVGDSPVDDVEGAMGVGMQVVLIQRDGQNTTSTAPTIRSLDQLVDSLVSAA